MGFADNLWVGGEEERSGERGERGGGGEGVRLPSNVGA